MKQDIRRGIGVFFAAWMIAMILSKGAAGHMPAIDFFKGTSVLAFMVVLADWGLRGKKNG